MLPDAPCNANAIRIQLMTEGEEIKKRRRKVTIQSRNFPVFTGRMIDAFGLSLTVMSSRNIRLFLCEKQK